MKKKKKILPISIIFTLIVAIVIGSASIAGASTILSIEYRRALGPKHD